MDWCLNKLEGKKYELEFLEKEKVVLFDLSEASSENISRKLLDDIYNLSGELKAEELYISVSSLSPKKNSIVRNLLVFGFERVDDDRFTSNKEIILLKMEVNQEYDFVDLI